MTDLNKLYTEIIFEGNDGEELYEGSKNFYIEGDDGQVLCRYNKWCADPEEKDVKWFGTYNSAKKYSQKNHLGSIKISDYEITKKEFTKPEDEEATENDTNVEADNKDTENNADAEVKKEEQKKVNEAGEFEEDKQPANVFTTITTLVKKEKEAGLKGKYKNMEDFKNAAFNAVVKAHPESKELLHKIDDYTKKMMKAGKIKTSDEFLQYINYLNDKYNKTKNNKKEQ